MPWTFAHPAAVLPLRSFRWLPFGALVVGSLSPDLCCYVSACAIAAKAHTLAGAIVGNVCLAILIGAITHIVWDAFTHPAGYFVAQIPALRTVPFTVRGRAFPLFEVMQHVSTVVGVVVLTIAYQRVSRQVALGSLGSQESDVWRHVLLVTAAVLSMASTTVFTVVLAAAGLVNVRRKDAGSREDHVV